MHLDYIINTQQLNTTSQPSFIIIFTLLYE